MCGIAGKFEVDRTVPVDEALLRQMCDVIVHRGPDADGYYAQDGVGLGMRRLSIIDLSTGKQPVHNEDCTVWVVYNGEIYNYLPLRAELEKQGHRFYTNSDTEVIVHLYEQYGNDCVKHLRGMFAFAVYDRKRDCLLIARDRLGKKPLHYSCWNGEFIFASEIKSLLVARPELADVDTEALLSFFRFSYIPDPQSAFRRISKLPPGHAMEVKRDSVRTWQYWELPAYSTWHPATEEECLERLEQCLAEAVRIRLMSEVPLGALLSGGVDSSVVVALMARASTRPVNTFSISFDEQSFSEAKYARQVSERFQTEHHELVLKPDIVETLTSVTHLMEEPFGDASVIPTYHVSRLARQHVTVALAGDGGDELFAGYTRYATNLSRSAADYLPSGIGRFARQRLLPLLPEAMPGRRLLNNLSYHSRDRYLDNISQVSREGPEGALLSSDFRGCAASGADGSDSFRKIFDSGLATDLLSRHMLLDSKTYLPFDILTKVDRMSMANSLEVRAPLLDHKFFELAVSLDAKWKLRGGQAKYALKQLALRVGVPPEVLNRPKQGFALPLVHWIKRDDMKGLFEILLEPRTLQRGYVNPSQVHRLLDEHKRGVRVHSGRIWMLLIFELWHRNFLEEWRSRSTSPRQASEVAAR